jgi:phosphoglycolate phosphatase
MANLVIFDFDSTLFDTHQSIEHTIKLTFETILPNYVLPQDEIYRLIVCGASLSNTFRVLHPNTTHVLVCTFFCAVQMLAK